MKVENVEKNGRAIPNQFVIHSQEGRSFQSYNSTIIFWSNDGKIYLDTNKWDYSVTTGKYRNLLLGEKKSETKKKIKDGIYILKDLNA